MKTKRRQDYKFKRADHETTSQKEQLKAIILNEWMQKTSQFKGQKVECQLTNGRRYGALKRLNQNLPFYSTIIHSTMDVPKYGKVFLVQ